MRFLPLIIFSLTAPAALASTIMPEGPAHVSNPLVGLSVAIKKGSSGLDFEGEGAAEFRKQALEFIKIRKSQLSTKERFAAVTNCFARTEENIFCSFMIDRKTRKKDLEAILAATPKLEEDDDTPVATQDVFKISEYLSQADISKFKGVKEAHLHKAMRLFPNGELLQGISDAALSSKECASPELLTVLGQKAEEFFPEPRFKKLAIDLYSRADECSDMTHEKARYRLSLLLIDDGQCKRADPVLMKLSENTEKGDFISRSLFWRAQCAKTSGNKLLFASIKGRLLKEYPLSYHGLLLTRGQKGALGRSLDVREPLIRFRSKSKPEFNNVIRAVEALQSLRANDLAFELLDSINDQLDQSEVPFRLYVALLMGRAGNTIQQFKVLSGVFKDQPSSITRRALELFYPLKRLDVLQSHASKVDPFLMAALIRQESGFNEHARSRVGALGLMQLMPATARRMERVSLRELLDAKTNIRLGVRYYVSLVNRFDGDAELALAGYNAGPEKVDEWKRRYTTSNRMLFFDLIPFKETRDYVALIARNYYWYLNLYGDWVAAQEKQHPPYGPSRKLASGTSKKPLVFTLFSPLY